MVHSLGSDATVQIGDVLPSVVMEAPPRSLAAELEAMSTNPYLHFELAPHGKGALEFLPGKQDPVMLRAAATQEGIGAAQHLIQDDYESWINRKT